MTDREVTAWHYPGAGYVVQILDTPKLHACNSPPVMLENTRCFRRAQKQGGAP